MMNEYENYLIDALDLVSAWDLPEEDLADACLLYTSDAADDASSV